MYTACPKVVKKHKKQKTEAADCYRETAIRKTVSTKKKKKTVSTV